MWGCIGAHTKSCVTVARDNHRADYDDDDDDDDDNDEGVNDIDEPQRDAWKCIGTDMKSCVTVARNDHRADYYDDYDDDDDDDGVNDKTSHDMHEA